MDSANLMTGERPRRSRPRDRKAQLAVVAAELFCARGFHEVGINDIAGAAGVTGPALYRHFSDKQAILAHVVLSGIDELITTTKLALDDAATPAPDQAEAALSNLAKLSVERRDIAALWRWERRNLDPEAQREVRHQSAELVQLWSDTLRAIRPGLAPADAELLCWAALSVFGSAAVHSTRIGKRRYAALLIAGARAVLHTSLPVADSPHPIPAGRADEPILRTSRREQLITEAGRLFAERGFHEVSMEDIGAAAGISGPSVYRHFPGKAALFVAASHRIAHRLELGRLQIAASAASEAEALYGLAMSYVDVMSTSADLLSVGRQVSALSESDRSELRRIQRDYVDEWARLLCAVRPELNSAEARVTVHMALAIANDLIRTGRIRSRPNVHAELVALMSSALELPRPGR